MYCSFNTVLPNGSMVYDFDMGTGSGLGSGLPLPLHLPAFVVSLICGVAVIGTGLAPLQPIHNIRLPLHDIESISLLVNDQPIETIVNYSRTEELVTGCLPDQYEFPILFNNGMPLNNIYGNIKIRIIFWRQPISAFLVKRGTCVPPYT